MADFASEYLFDLQADPDLVKAYYDENGFVVLTGVFNQEEVRTTIAEVAEMVNVDYDDISTYDNFSGNRFGVIGKEPLIAPCLNRNRFHKNVVQAYKMVYGASRTILPCFDRVAWMRPELVNSAWATPYKAPGLHLDVSPVAYYEEHESVNQFLAELQYNKLSDFTAENNAKHEGMGLQVQGVINLVDNYEDDGGFHCVPGGHLMLKEWYQKAKHRLPRGQPCGRYNFSNSYKEDAVLCSYSMRVCSPAGSLILFDCLLPHGTKPNQSNSSRIIQFLRYVPEDIFVNDTRRNRSVAVKRIVNSMTT